ncbi:MAG: DNA polymerase III subunit gamma/tau [Pseudomonadota bacterium]
MSYLVLARKWRPQTFEEVVGQPSIVQTLQNAIRTNRVAQAFLFTGPRGVGKTSVARILAKALNCKEGPTPTPCNICDACREITKSIAPDVFEIDGASNTGVDHVRDLQETIKYYPQKYRYKIFIVDEVHMLSTPAFNAFLKTLEEPPSHVIFIFATTEPHKILDTVIDRCQRYDFKKIPSPVILHHLHHIVQQEQITISTTSLQLIAREAEGSLRDAQSMVDQIVTYAGSEVKDEDVTAVLGLVERTIFFGVASAVLEGDLKKCLEISSTLFAHGLDMRVFYRGLLEHFRNLGVAKISTSAQLFPDFSSSEITQFALQAKEVSLEKLQGLLKVLIESERYIYGSPLPLIVLETILLRIASLPSVVSLKEILDKLAAFQEKLLHGPCSSKASTAFSDAAPESSGLNEHPEKPLSLLPLDHEGSQEASWKALLDFVREKKPLLASLLEHGNLVKKGPGTVDIEFMENSFFLESIQEVKKNGELDQLCTEFFGEKIKVNLLDLPLRTKNPEKQKQGLSKAQIIEKRKQEARDHPLIKEALALLGGGITEIKVMDS